MDVDDGLASPAGSGHSVGMALALESRRLKALQSFQLLDTPPEPELDELAAAAARVCGAPVGLLSLSDRHRQFFKARVGVDFLETPRKGSFCEHAIASDGLFEVRDATLDDRFRAHPMVNGAPHIRFYAATPLVSRERAAIGTLCVLDWQPRALSQDQGEILRILGRQVMAQLERRRQDLARKALRRALDEDLRGRLQHIVQGVVQRARGIEILTDAEHASQVLDDVVEMLAGEPGLHRVPMDLAPIFDTLASVFREPGRRIVVSTDGDCRGDWDADRITHALSALIEAAASGPEVRAELRGQPDAVLLTIAGSSAPAVSAGDEVRLALARRIIEAHDGALEVSGAPGGEVSVRVCLPR